MSTQSAAPRLDYFDGLRGWMALIVVLSHLLASWLLDPGQLERQGAGWLTGALPWTPLAWICDGVMAVVVFFAISGVALSYPILRASTPDRTLAGMAGYRYFRLTGPSLASCLLVCALAWAGLMFNASLSGISHAQLPISGFFGAAPDFGAAASEALWRMYFDRPQVNDAWNPVLWTMAYELEGSLIVFALLAIVRWRPVRIALAVALTIYFHHYYYAGFFCGYLIAEFLVARERQAAFSQPVDLQPLGWLLLAAALATITFTEVYFGYPRQYGYLPFLNLTAALLVGGVALVQPAQRFLVSRASLFLGRVSFALYLTHLAVLCSFSSAIYLSVAPLVPYWLAVALITAVSIPACLFVAWVFTVLVEERAMRALKRVIVGAIFRLFDAARGVAPAGNPLHAGLRPGGPR